MEYICTRVLTPEEAWKEQLWWVRESVLDGLKLTEKEAIDSEHYDLNLAELAIGLVGRARVQALASVLQNQDIVSGDLLHLNLSWNFLNDQHMPIIAPVISKCSKLEYLNLWNNKIGDEGCIALSNNLPINLKKLILAWNKIRDEGCRALSKKLPRSLKELDLSKNKTGLDGFNELLKLMELTSNHLERVGMEENEGHKEVSEQYELVRRRKIDELKELEATAKAKNHVVKTQTELF